MAELTVTRRHLPHWSQDGAWYYVTFCLKDGQLTTSEQVRVLNHIITGHGQFYRLVAVSVMPDHVHIILVPSDRRSLSSVLKGLKGSSARLINRLRGTSGSLWQSESWDRILRDGELQEKLLYMLQNPVEEGLSDDPWSYHGWHLQS